jgi:hypothetical protein
MFDILFQLYTNEGYGRRQAIENIFRKNLIGIDLDTRARQLATFSLLMNACQKDKSFLDARVMPRVYDMPRPFCEEFASEYDPERQDEKAFIKEQINPLVPSQDQEVCDELSDAIIVMDHADTLGSIMQFELSERTRNILQAQLQETEAQHYLTDRARKILPYVRIILALTEKYSALVMNPPYMGSGNMNATLSDYVKKHYKEGKADLFSVFMLLAVRRLAPNGKYGMINMQSWMFLSSFENLRKQLLEHEQIDSLLHLGPRTFDELSGEVVQNVAFVISLHSPKYMGTYYRLVDGKNCADKENRFLTKQGEYPNVGQKKFEQIPGSPIGYWVSEKILLAFRECGLKRICETRCGLSTGRNDVFLRLWYEVNIFKIGFSLDRKVAQVAEFKWFPYDKAGEYRKWFGNREYVLNWEKDGAILQNTMHPDGKRIWAHNFNLDKIFNPHIGWSDIISGGLSFRYFEKGFNFDGSANAAFTEQKYFDLILSFANSKIVSYVRPLLNPTLHFKPGNFLDLPFKIVNIDRNIVHRNISLSRQDWDAHETSWDFKENELICIGKEKGTHLLEDCYKTYVEEWTDKFMQLHANEEELNRQFIDIYGLQDELTPDVPLDEITILQQGEISIEEDHLVWHPDVVMKQLISYIVGVWMGRYRLDRSGLYIAYPNPSAEELAPYTYHGQTVTIDDDAIIPLLPRDSPFEDNLVNRIVDFVRIVFGADMLTENLNFIERQLGMSIEQYVLKDFWKDHKKMYHNRPIYWLFSSRKGAFQCLVYMHRMDAYTAERVRSKYLLPYMDWLLNRLHELEENAANLSTVERREMDRITRQIAECREYHDRLHVVADRQEGFDLDDGVVVNYAKFGDVLAKLK